MAVSLFAEIRQPGQGGAADGLPPVRDLRAQLLQAEAAHFAKVRGEPVPASNGTNQTDSGENERLEGASHGGSGVSSVIAGEKRRLENGDDGRGNAGTGEAEDGGAEEDYEAKRQRVLEETRAIDADSEDDVDEDEDSSDDRFVLCGIVLISLHNGRLTKILLLPYHHSALSLLIPWIDMRTDLSSPFSPFLLYPFAEAQSPAPQLFKHRN